MNWKREPSYKEFNVVVIIKPARTTSTSDGLLIEKSIAPVIISDLIIKLLPQLRMFFKVLICRHGTELFLWKKKWQYESFLKLYKTEKSEVIFITFNSCTSTISFSKRSDSFRDFSSASLSSINCSQTTQIYSKIKCNVFE